MRRVILGLILVIAVAMPWSLSATVQSHNVLIIGGPTVINGGTFPTTGIPAGATVNLNTFVFTSVAASTFNAQPDFPTYLAGFDTVLLNVAGNMGMNCNVNNLSGAAKTGLVNWLGLGNKLIIYDSECSSQNYGWLPYSFTTNNPGAMGAPGTLTIVEDNHLASNNPASPYYINAPYLSTSTDAIGDMNVLTSYNSNWCVNMSGTNYNHVTGPVHTYARYPTGYDKGLIIYNGMDMDYLNYGTNHLAKIWLQELLQPFNPAGATLSSCVPVTGISISPMSALRQVNTTHTETATVTDLLNQPVQGTAVTITVTGQNPGTVTGNSDLAGHVAMTYTGTTLGLDSLQACIDNSSPAKCSLIAKVQWINCDFNNSRTVDILDINLIKAQIGNTPTADPTMDNDLDGFVTSSDVRRCALVCTKTGCAQ